MQKSKKKKWLFVFLILLFGITKVNAECDNAKLVELSRQANNVKANYELTEVMYDIGTGELMDPEDSEYTREELEEMEQDAPYAYKNVVRINVQNITKDLYVRISDNVTKEEKEIHYSDTNDGTYSELITDVSAIRLYTINIYSEDPCTIDLLRKNEITTPMHNDYYYIPVCEQSEAYYCQEWVTVEVNMTEDEVIEKEIKKYQKNIDETKEEESFWKKNKNVLIVIGIVVFIAIGAWVGFTMIKRKRSRAI